MTMILLFLWKICPGANVHHKILGEILNIFDNNVRINSQEECWEIVHMSHQGCVGFLHKRELLI